MFGLPHQRQVVTAYGKQWVTLHHVGAIMDDAGKPIRGRSLYLAAPIDADMPAPVSLIEVEE